MGRTALLSIAFVFSMAQAAPYQPGRLIDPVACAADPSQTYALYLPSTYTSDRRWPLLLVFDPRSRGAHAAEIFRKAAEQFGWIIASSNNTHSDGPWEPNQRAVAAMLPDLLARLPIDERPLLPALRSALKLPSLQRDAAKKGPGAEAAQRSLEGIYVQVSFYLPRDFVERRQYDRAALAFEIAAAIHPERPHVWYELAAWQAMSSARDAALRSLDRAVAAGLTGRARVEQDDRFTALRGDEAFAALLARIPS